MISKAETLYLRDLAKQVKELSVSLRQREIIDKFRANNSLNPSYTPPIIINLTKQAMDDYMCDEQFRMQGGPLAGIEYWLKWQICRSTRLRDDLPITGTLFTGFRSHVTDWMDGYKPVKMLSDLKSSFFKPCLLQYSDIKKLRQPMLEVDWLKTNEDFQLLNDVFGDILRVVKGAPFNQTCGWGESMIDQFVEMRGLEQFYYDLVDAPEFVHEAMDFMTNAKLNLLEQYKSINLLVLNNNEVLIGSSSLGFCNELPVDGFDPHQVRESDLWGFAQAQELSAVSPDMLEEFILPYQARIMNRFGLACYGCCEAIESKIDSVAKYIKNLRMISISPFTNYEIAAQKCKGKYVFAWKPQPSYVMNYNEDMIRKEMESIVKYTKGCCVSILLLDTYLSGKDLPKYNKWLALAREITAGWFDDKE